MLSSFCSREFGYDMIISNEDMALINNYRDGKTYPDDLAAQTINGTNKKQPLTKSPFVRTLEYGANAGGYWTYDRMVLQLEDCIDIMKVLYPQFDCVFLFDHSNGHDRMKPDGLSTKKLERILVVHSRK